MDTVRVSGLSGAIKEKSRICFILCTETPNNQQKRMMQSVVLLVFVLKRAAMKPCERAWSAVSFLATWEAAPSLASDFAQISDGQVVFSSLRLFLEALACLVQGCE